MSSALTPKEVEAFLKKHKPTEITKVLALGNSGVGKSYLLNALMQRNDFESKFSATSVTSSVECNVHMGADSHAFVLYNLPGLIESNQNKIARNKLCIETAFKHREEHRVIVLFVFGNEGGRIRDEDIQAWLAISKYAPELTHECAGFVINKVNEDEFDTDEAKSNYEASITRQLREQCQDRFVCYFMPKLDKAERSALSGPNFKRIQANLIKSLRDLKAERVQPEPGALLVLDRDFLHEQLDAIRRQSAEALARYQEEAKKMSEEHKRVLEELKQQTTDAMAQRDRHFQKEMESLQAELVAVSAKAEASQRARDEALARQLEQHRAETAQRAREDALARQQDQQRLEAARASEDAMARKLEAHRQQQERADAAQRTREEAIARQLQQLQLQQQQQQSQSHWQPAPCDYYSSSGHRGSSQPLSWNQFQQSVGGQGLSKDEISEQYWEPANLPLSAPPQLFFSPSRGEAKNKE